MMKPLGPGPRPPLCSAQLPLARSLALKCSTRRHTGSCFSARSLARSPLARPLSACSLARSRSLTATHRRTGITVRHGLLRTARLLASSPLAHSPLARSLVLRSLARSLTAAQPHIDTLVSPKRALQRGHPQQTATAMLMLLSRPPWWVCDGGTDAWHLSICASSINRKQSKTCL